MKFDHHFIQSNMTVLKSFLLTGLFPFVLISCKEQQQTEGGPCSYKTEISPATIIAIEQIDSTHSEISFSVIKASGPDTVTYSHFFHEFATQEIIKKCDLRIGNALQFEEREIVKGTCSPYLYRLKLEKYKP